MTTTLKPIVAKYNVKDVVEFKRANGSSYPCFGKITKVTITEELITYDIVNDSANNVHIKQEHIIRKFDESLNI